MSHYVEDPDLSVAWGRALQLVTEPGRSEVGSLTISVTGFAEDGAVVESPAIRRALDALLRARGKQTVETVANTIFPTALWNPAAPRQQLFDRYLRITPRLRRLRANAHGTYFERMISGGPTGQANQLDFAISTYTGRRGVRRSMLQVGVFNPALDHSAAALRGFPCLQHVTFAPIDGRLHVNAFYATQYMVARAYGNYLGLCRLGQFVAREMGIALARLTCLVGIGERDGPVGDLRPVLAAVRRAIERAEEE